MSNLPPPPPPSESPPPPPPDDFSVGGFSGGQQLTPASKGRRVAAGFLELALYIGISIVTTVLWFIIVGSSDTVFETSESGTVVSFGRMWFAVPWLLLSAMFFRWSSTPSKRPLNMFIVDARTGQLAGFGQIALREWGGKFVLGTLTGGLTYLIGAVMLLVTGRSLWDFIARTNVVTDR